MAADIGIDATTSLDEAYAEALAKHGPDAKVIVLPFARYQLPRNAIRMTSEPLQRAGRCPRLTTSAARRPIVEMLGSSRAARRRRLMSRLAWPCAHCGGAFHEPLTLAAKRHANDPRAVLDRLPRARRRRAERGADRRGARGRWREREGRGRAVGGAGRARASRTRRCCAARGGSWTTSSPCRTRGTPRSSARRSRTRASVDRRGRRARAAGRRRRPDRRGRRGDVAAVPGRRSRTAPPYYAAADGTARYAGEPRRRRRRRVALRRRGRGRARRRRLRAARRRGAATVHERSFSYGAVERRSRRPTSSSRGRFVFPRWIGTPGRVLRRDRRLARRRR